MSDNQPPAWAMEKARNALGPYHADGGAVTLAESVARALADARRAAIEEVAQHQESLAGNPKLRKQEADLIRTLASLEG